MNAALCDALKFLGERISTGCPRRVSKVVHQTMYILTVMLASMKINLVA